jgi:nucleotide-binding universal stress UspA family protein
VYECDEPTLQRAATLAKDNCAKLTIVYPAKSLPGGQQKMTMANKPIDIGKLVLQEYKSRLENSAKTARSLGVRPATKVLVGDPALEIVRDVIEQQRDLVIMTAEGKGGLKQRLFGSTSTHLMRKCPVPLFVMKPSRRKRFHQILAAIDPEVTGDARDTLNALILELGLSLSAREDANLHVVHAWTLFGESLMRGRGGMYAAEVDRAVRQEAEKRHRVVQSLLAKHSVTGCQLHLPKGDAAEAIPRLVGKLAVDVLVMGTVCRTGIPSFIIGNTAERVLDTVDCSVLVVKPEGFVSPMAPLVAAKGDN